MLAGALGPCALAACTWAGPSPAAVSNPGADGPPAVRRQGRGTGSPAPAAKRRRRRRFLVGLEGVVLQVPALRPRVLRLDPRFVGNAVALGGAGLVARYRPIPLVGIEISARSGSVVYRNEDREKLLSQDMVIGTAGVLLYVAQGDVARLAADAGLGGQFHRVAYFSGGGRSVQRFGAFLTHVGLDAEFLLSRVAFILSVRAYGVVTGSAGHTTSGPLFEGASASDQQLPVPTFQTYAAASAGLAYRF